MRYLILFIFTFIGGAFYLQAEGLPSDNNFLVKDSADASIQKSVSNIDKYYSSLFQSGKFNGNILISYKGNTIYKKSFGYAVKDSREMLNAESSFQLASTSKPFTAAAILQLYEQGKLSLEDLVSDYYPGFPYKVTIRNLLSHRSGLPDYMDCAGLFPKKTYLSNQDVMDMFIQRRPRALTSPNAVFKYNNSNFAILAALVEKISGEDFDQYCEENIFEPLGMKNTWVWHPEQSRKKGQTNGYNASWTLRRPDMFDGVHGDKGVYSTAEDLLKWDQSWNNHQLLKATTVKAAYEGQSKGSSGKDYGLGWRTKELDNNKKMIYHNGWWHDYNIVFKRFIDDSLTIIILSNKFNQAIYKTEYVETALLEKNNFFDTNLNKVLYAKKEDEEDDVEENKSIIELNPFNYITNNTIVSTNSKSSDNQNLVKNSKLNVYVVKKGDTLFNIAQKFDITIETLKKWNKMATANIQLGQKLFIDKLNGNE